MTIPYLPLDVVDTILESRWLPPTTLANCCLVNRNWLDLSRRRLYRSISVVVHQRWESDEDEDEDEEADIISVYSEATSQLRQTLETNPILAACVREIAFAFDDTTSMPSTDRIDGPESAVLSFVKLCRQAKSFDFGHFSGYNSWPALIEVRDRVEVIRLELLARQSWQIMNNFKNLKVVDCRFEFNYARLPSASTSQPLTTSLNGLTLSNQHSISIIASFKLFLASYSTITAFTCSLCDLQDIDLTLLEALQQLTLQVWSEVMKITQSVKNCRQLRSLSIRSMYSPLTESQGRTFFGTQVEEVPSPPKLHLLRFTPAPPPNILAIAFQVFPSGAASKQLSISTRRFGKLVYNRDSDEVSQYLNQVRSMCRAQDVELFLMEHDEYY